MNKAERIEYLKEHNDEIWELAKRRAIDATDVELKAFELINKGNRLLFHKPEITPEQWYYDDIVGKIEGDNHNHSVEINGLNLNPYLDRIRYDHLKEHEMYLCIKDNKVIHEVVFDGNSLRCDNDDEYKLNRLKEAKALNAGLYLVHNHPGDLVVNPSPNDDVVTRFMKKNADELGVELLDVAIVSLDDYYSYKQKGKLI